MSWHYGTRCQASAMLEAREVIGELQAQVLGCGVQTWEIFRMEA